MGNIRIDIDGNGAKKKLEDMQQNLKKVEGKQTVPFSELFNRSFMLKYSNFSSFNDLLNESGLLEKYGDFESIDDDEWDSYIQKNTKFMTWEDMKAEAGKIWMLKRIGL